MSKTIAMSAFCALAVISLSGCKIELGTEIPLSGLLGDELKTAAADLYVEIPSCNSYEDSRQPSNGLVSAKNEISQIIPESEYKECFTKKFNSFALFSVPVAYGPEKLVTKETTQIRVLQAENKFAFVIFGSKLREKLDSAKNKPSVSGGFKPSDVSINIKIKNDTGKDIQANFAGVYVGGEPVIYAPNVKMENGQEWPLKLSDVTTSELFGDSKRAAWFMSDIKK